MHEFKLNLPEMKPKTNPGADALSKPKGPFLGWTYAARTPTLTQTKTMRLIKANQVNSRKVLFGASRPQTGAGVEKVQENINILRELIKGKSNRPKSAARTFIGPDPSLPKINPISPLHERQKLGKENVMAEGNKVNEKNHTTIDAYQIGKQIGRGAYATVKECVHKTHIGEKYAVKIYEKYQLLDPHRKRNVTREIDILKKLKHPNIVKLAETINGPKQLYIICELIKGGSLYSYIRSREGRKLDESEARRLFIQIVDALRYCHHKGVVHRDLKLENLLLDESKNVKIIDFGFSTVAPPNTKLHMFCGTPSYMAPEIVNKRDYYGPPADIWSLGVLLYAMLSGRFPFKGVTERELYRNIARGVYATPANVSQSAKSLLSKLLQVDPLKRPTCDEIIKDTFVCESSSADSLNILGGTMGFPGGGLLKF